MSKKFPEFGLNMPRRGFLNMVAGAIAAFLLKGCKEPSPEEIVQKKIIKTLESRLEKTIGMKVDIELFSPEKNPKEFEILSKILAAKIEIEARNKSGGGPITFPAPNAVSKALNPEEQTKGYHIFTINRNMDSDTNVNKVIKKLQEILGSTEIILDDKDLLSNPILVENLGNGGMIVILVSKRTVLENIEERGSGRKN